MSNPGIWLGLLKWSLGQTDGTMPTDAPEMSADDRAFLENVMKECVMDEPQRMQDIMTRFVELLNSNQATAFEEEIIDKLQELKDIVGQIDMAQTFVKFGGMECLFRLIELEDLDLEARSGAAATFGTVCQNNLTSQQAVYENGAMARLAAAYLATSHSILRAKLLYAISCLIRGLNTAEDRFVMDLSEQLFGIIAAADVNAAASLWSRGLYLASVLLTSDGGSASRASRIVPIFVRSEAVLRCLRSDNVDVREAMIAFLNAAINSVGGILMVTPHRSAIDTVLAEREQQLASDDVSKSSIDDNEGGDSVEQLQHEKMLLLDLVLQLEGRRRSQSELAAGPAVSSPNLLIGPGPAVMN
jgi:hypothetical protein